jgi:hypothetical protein
VVRFPVPSSAQAVSMLTKIVAALAIGFGRIVISEIEPPNLFVKLV